MPNAKPAAAATPLKAAVDSPANGIMPLMFVSAIMRGLLYSSKGMFAFPVYVTARLAGVQGKIAEGNIGRSPTTKGRNEHESLLINYPPA